MKVADIMQEHVDFVDSDTSIVDVARLIFGRGINGVPVCRNKKVVGFVTERDILEKFFPSVQDYMEDPFHEGNFEHMEDKSREILSLPVSKIMGRTPITIESNDPILRAQSLMSINHVGRLPVVDKKGNLIGIVSKGDIFKAVVGKEMPYMENEEYHDWIAKHFDMAIGMESRLTPEIESLTELFKNNNIEKVLDMGCGTGEHAIALAKKGFKVVGIDNSQLMFNIAKEKWNALPQALKENVQFIQGDYVGKLKEISNGEFEAAIFMGGMLGHMAKTYQEVLGELNRVLSRKNSLIVAQVANFDKSIKVKGRLHKFDIVKSHLSPNWEHAYYWFCDPPRKKGGNITLNAAILDFNGTMWTTKSMNSVQVVPFHKEELVKVFKKSGFPKTSFYGIKIWEKLFENRFKPLESDYLIAVAKR